MQPENSFKSLYIIMPFLSNHTNQLTRVQKWKRPVREWPKRITRPGILLFEGKISNEKPCSSRFSLYIQINLIN